ncbi:MAG: DUF3105 domain-containing protein [Actinomycetota bacterium]|nr:DUF3105 domain-containing protein [Actinomycetota bacterium]
MSSRKEEKERLRREREEAERAHKAAENRRKRLGIVLGGLLALAVAAVVVFALLSGDDESGPTDGGNGDSVALPARKTSDLDEAVKAAGCTLTEHPDEGNQHLPGNDDSYDDYKTNPPTSGTHRPVAAADGVYEPGRSADPENWVHTLEHGRVIFMYKPGTPANRRGQLETLMNEEFNGQPEGYKTVVMENNTDMEAAVAAVSWRRSLTCPEFTDATFDALRAFRSEFVDDELAPEPEFPWPYTGT